MTQAAQTPQYSSNMGTKDTPIDMGLINDYVSQAPEKPPPGPVIGHYTNVKHVRIGKYYPRPSPYLRPLRSWCITIKGGKFLHTE